MKPYFFDKIPATDILLWHMIKNAVDLMPDKINLGKDEKDEEIILSCHILARAVAKTFSVRCIDGKVFPNFFHSWILTANGNIIDVYPLATLGGPILIYGGNETQVRWHYQPQNLRRELGNLFDRAHFKRAVNKVAKLLAK